jgi:hypothetical protein
VLFSHCDESASADEEAIYLFKQETVNRFLMEESELVGTVSSSLFCKGGLRGIFQWNSLKMNSAKFEA